MHPVCDKCGGAVLPADDAAKVILLLGRQPITVARHLRPVTRDGHVICEGSPSLLQYLDGFPRDQRPGARYVPEIEEKVRAAVRQLADSEDEADDPTAALLQMTE